MYYEKSIFEAVPYNDGNQRAEIINQEHLVVDKVTERGERVRIMLSQYSPEIDKLMFMRERNEKIERYNLEIHQYQLFINTLKILL